MRKINNKKIPFKFIEKEKIYKHKLIKKNKRNNENCCNFISFFVLLKYVYRLQIINK